MKTSNHPVQSSSAIPNSAIAARPAFSSGTRARRTVIGQPVLTHNR
jgi:hypothetical protein